jgi:hypothetical protein
MSNPTVPTPEPDGRGTPVAPTPQPPALDAGLRAGLRRSVVLLLTVTGVMLAVLTLIVVRIAPSWAEPLGAVGAVLGLYLPVAAMVYAVVVRPWRGPDQ